MKTCTQCPKPLPETSALTECGTCRRRMRRAAVAKGEIPPPATERVRDVQPDRTALLAQVLILRGYVPPPFQIDAHDARPLWDFSGLAQMFDMGADELADLLVKNGPVHLPEDGIPSSWKLLEGASV